MLLRFYVVCAVVPFLPSLTWQPTSHDQLRRPSEAAGWRSRPGQWGSRSRAAGWSSGVQGRGRYVSNAGEEDGGGAVAALTMPGVYVQQARCQLHHCHSIIITTLRLVEPKLPPVRAGFKCVEALGRIVIRGPYPASNAIIYTHLQL